jgi:hypothetical protein
LAVAVLQPGGHFLGRIDGRSRQSIHRGIFTALGSASVYERSQV